MSLLHHLIRDLSLHSSRNIELLKKFHQLRCNTGKQSCYVDIAKKNAAYSGYDVNSTAAIKHARMLGDNDDIIDFDDYNYNNRGEKRARYDNDDILPPVTNNDHGEKRSRQQYDLIGDDEDSIHKRARYDVLQPLPFTPTNDGDGDEQKDVDLDSLPDEILIEIAQNLPLQAVAKFCQVSQRFTLICKDVKFWRNRVEILAAKNGITIDKNTIRTIEDYSSLINTYYEIFGENFNGDEIMWRNMTQYDYCHALEEASKYGYHDVIRLLIDHGADIYFSECGSVALGTAISFGHKDVVEGWLDRGITVGDYDEILAAIRNGHREVIELLINHGVDMNITTDSSALLWAIRYDHVDIAELLLDNGANVNGVNESGDWGSALLLAIYRKNVSMIRLLLERGADVNGYNQRNNSNLELASKLGNAEIVQILLDHGADLSSDTESSLQLASENGHTEVVQILLDAGADASFDAALKAAIYNENDEIVKILKDASNKRFRRIQQSVGRRPSSVMTPLNSEGDTGNDNESFLSNLRNLPRNLYRGIYLAPRVEEQYNKSEEQNDDASEEDN